MADEWFFMKNGRKMGPLSSKAIVELAAAGRLLPTDSVQKKGSATWQEASAIKGLFPQSPAAPAAPPAATEAAPKDVEPGYAVEGDGDEYEPSSALPAPRLSRRRDRQGARTPTESNETGGRVFNTYFSIGYIRTLWTVNVAIAMLGAAAVIGLTIMRILSGSPSSTEVLTEILMGLGVCGAIAIELVMVRISLETVAVFFDILHEVQRIGTSIDRELASRELAAS